MDTIQIIGYLVIATSLINFFWLYEEMYCTSADHVPRISNRLLYVYIYFGKIILFFNLLSIFIIPLIISFSNKWYSGIISFLFGYILCEILFRGFVTRHFVLRQDAYIRAMELYSRNPTLSNEEIKSIKKTIFRTFLSRKPRIKFNPAIWWIIQFLLVISFFIFNQIKISEGLQ